MPDRVHPTPHSEAEDQRLIINPLYHHPVPPTSSRPGTYIAHFPEHRQIPYYTPPPNKVPTLARRPCLIPCLCILLIIIIIASMSGAVFYCDYLPKAPKYSIDSLSVHGFNITSSAFSPIIDVTVRAQNPNTKIGIYYAKGSSIQVSHPDIGELCTGILPVFYQPANNITIFQTQLRSTNSIMLETHYKKLTNQEKKKQIPLNTAMEVPVKIKFGSVKTWTTTFKVQCRITLSNLAKDVSIVHKDCSVNFKPWK